ncbi:MAG: hypothetical protein CSB16_00355 [Clostridiales bacterium]|nr:MAG: hypothetical protein CSB16_00355 [Clostridiales bacterium]
MKIKIETEYIKLDSLLKLSNIVGSGGMAKNLIKEGLVKFNGEKCFQRGKKVRPGDKITINIDGKEKFIELEV